MATTPRRPRAIGYIRLSDFRGKSDPSTSPDRQRDAVKGYATAQGWDLVDVIEDLDVSGSQHGLRLNRPGLLRIREMFDDVDHVVVPSVDRLARNVVDFMVFADEAASRGVAIASVRERLDLASHSGRFVAQILASFAEHEAATIRSRVLAGNAAARASGRFLGGVPPYGYRSTTHPSGHGRTLEIDPVEAEVVHWMAERVIDEDWGPYRIATELNCAGTKSKTGKQWSVQSVRAVLTGQAVLGRTTHRGETVRGEDGLPIQPYPTLLTRSEWDQVRLRLEAGVQGNRRKRRAAAARLLSGLVYCGLCGLPMNPGPTGGDGRSSYRCSGRSRGWVTCPGVSIRCEPLEDFVVEKWMDAFAEVSFTFVVEHHAEGPPPEAEEISAAIDDTLQAMRSDEADLTGLTARLEALKERRRAVLDQVVPTYVEERESGLLFLDSWREAEGDVVAQRNLLADALDGVVILPGRAGRRPMNPDRVSIRWLSEKGTIRPADLKKHASDITV